MDEFKIFTHTFNLINYIIFVFSLKSLFFSNVAIPQHYAHVHFNYEIISCILNVHSPISLGERLAKGKKTL